MMAAESDCGNSYKNVSGEGSYGALHYTSDLLNSAGKWDIWERNMDIMKSMNIGFVSFVDFIQAYIE